MEAIRKIMTLDDRMRKLELPKRYRGTIMGLIILPTEKQEKASEPNVGYKSMYGSF